METIPLFVMAMGNLHQDFARQDVGAERCELSGTFLNLSV
jgi:hypothetical protein